MATWTVWVKATKNGEQKLHMSVQAKGDSESEARNNALEKTKSSQISYKDCSFTTTTAQKIGDN